VAPPVRRLPALAETRFAGVAASMLAFMLRRKRTTGLRFRTWIGAASGAAFAHSELCVQTKRDDVPARHLKSTYVEISYDNPIQDPVQTIQDPEHSIQCAELAFRITRQRIPAS